MSGAKPRNQGSKREENRKRFHRIGASVAFAASMGLVAYWSKRKADTAYDHYLASAKPKRQQKFFSHAERYDRISGAALLGMEAGLALTVYLAVFSGENK